MAAAQESRQQGAAAPDRAEHGAAVGIRVVGHRLLIAAVRVPVDVAVVVIENQHRPVLGLALRDAHGALAPILDAHRGLAATIDVGTGVDRVLEQVQHALVARRLPHDTFAALGVGHSRQFDASVVQPEAQASGTAEFGELAEHQLELRTYD